MLNSILQCKPSKQQWHGNAMIQLLVVKIKSYFIETMLIDQIPQDGENEQTPRSKTTSKNSYKNKKMKLKVVISKAWNALKNHRTMTLFHCLYLQNILLTSRITFTRAILQGGFFNWSSQFSVPKWKAMGTQSENLFHEVLGVQKIIVGWTTFFFLALKFGRTS